MRRSLVPMKGDQCHNSRPFSGRRFIFLHAIFTADAVFFTLSALSLFSDAALFSKVATFLSLFLMSLLFCRYF